MGENTTISLKYTGYDTQLSKNYDTQFCNLHSSAVRTYYTRGLETLRKRLEGLQFSAADLSEVMEAFSPGFSQHNGSGWLGEMSEE
jgi:hypothetical protein